MKISEKNNNKIHLKWKWGISKVKHKENMNYLMLSQMTSNLYKNKVGSLHYFINQNYFQVYKVLKTMTKLTVLELPLGF